MSQVIFFEECLARTTFKLQQMEAKIDFVAQRLQIAPRQVIENTLTEDEQKEYRDTLSRFEKLRQWEAVNHERN
jgi:hypothetical protein